MGHPILRNNRNICYRECSKSHDYELPLSSALKKPTVQYRFMEDTFVICPLIDFLKHLNSIHPQIQSKRKKETNVELLLSDILLNKRGNGTLGYHLYRKLTHTDHYLHKESKHQSEQKRVISEVLVHSATQIFETEHLS